MKEKEKEKERESFFFFTLYPLYLLGVGRRQKGVGVLTPLCFCGGAA